MIDRETLSWAAWRAGRGRRHQPEVRAFFANLEEELGAIRLELACGQPRCGECRQFTIHDPKERRITAPVFRERVLHHAVMAVCEPVLERRLTHHTYACRRGKGTLAAVKAAGAFARAHAWFLKCDIRKYFESIPRARLVEQVRGVFREERVCRILEVLVHAYEPGRERGLPIGSLISQHLANFYLAPLDTLVLQEIRPGGYVRYMDDFALWSDDRNELKRALARVGEFVGSLGLELKRDPFINRTSRGMDFLGFRVLCDRLALNRRSRLRFARKVRWLHRRWAEGGIAEREAQDRGTALVAFTQPADCRAWRRRIVSALDDAPTTPTASCGAGAGTTTAGTAGRPTGTRTMPATATTTSASVPSQLQRVPSWWNRRVAPFADRFVRAATNSGDPAVGR